MTAAPGLRTLTFLFADLESSTRLWERFPEAMRIAMERHDSILRASVEAAHGVVVKTTGDGLMACFPAASDAVVAALSGQERLAAEQWVETGPLRTRMGLNSGEAQAREDDYFGPPVNRAARIMSAAHGGQVLLSSLTATLAREGGLPDDATLRDLGEHRLKDLLQPERIFQLEHPDLKAEFPPLTTLARRPHNLPVQPSELVGREKELRAIRADVDTGAARLLTLTGPGGIGKTRLALQAAAEQIDRFADGVFFVDLSGARDSDSALSAIIRTVGLKATTDARLSDVLREQLRGRELLLVLDNFEQVMTAADEVATLLQQCAGLVMLVTSREALRVRGERLHVVAPLALPDASAGQMTAASVAGYEAVQLFVDRAQAVRPDFALTDANAGAVAEVCSRLDGLPLAIELAAARLRLFSPDELRDRLRRRLDVLRGGARDLPARQQTLRDTIEWSYELLDADERMVFSLLAVFAGASVEAVEEVAARIEVTRHVDIVERLASLLDKSLVHGIDGPGSQRLSMLETIREYAGERLAADSDLADEARRAHAEHFAEFAGSRSEALRGPERDTVIAALIAALENLKAGWRYWLGQRDLVRLKALLDVLWIVHETRGWYHDAIALASDLLEVLATMPPSAERLDEELTLRMGLARGLLAVRGYTAEVEEVYRAALALAESAGAIPERMPILRSLANFYLYRGEIDRTLAIGQQILAIGDSRGDTLFQLEGHFLVGVGTALMGDAPAGQRHLTAATSLFDPQRHGPARLRLGPSTGVTTYTSSALVHWLTGRLDSADRQAEGAMEMAHRLQHPYTLAYAHFHVGVLHSLSRRDELAAEHAESVLRIADEHDYAMWRALAHVLYGVSIARTGQPMDGLARTEQGLALYQVLTTPPVFWPNLLALAADACALAGDSGRSLEQLDEAIELTNELDLNLPYPVTQKANVLVSVGRTDEADACFQQALVLAQRLGARTAQLRAATGLARLYPSSAECAERLRQTLDAFDEGRGSVDVAEAREALGEPLS